MKIPSTPTYDAARCTIGACVAVAVFASALASPLSALTVRASE